MPSEVVLAVYRPKPGKEDALKAQVAAHWPALKQSGLVTDREPILLQSKDGSWIEIFEWKDGGASAAAAHEHPIIGPLWNAMMENCDFIPPSALPECAQPFPHFKPVDDLCEG